MDRCNVRPAGIALHYYNPSVNPTIATFYNPLLHQRFGPLRRLARPCLLSQHSNTNLVVCQCPQTRNGNSSRLLFNVLCIFDTALAISTPFPTPSPGPLSILGRGRYGRSSALRMSALVEQPVTADEAIALISKAKAIVEGDMGVKVGRPASFPLRIRNITPKMEGDISVI